MSSRFSVTDYARAFRGLMPRGRAWPEDETSVFHRVLKGLSGIYARSDAAAVALLKDAFPVGTVDLLPEWEASLGLPDPCAGPSPTVEQRQAAVHARFISGGGQSRARFIEFAAALGFTIEIEVYAPFIVDRSAVGEALADDAWSFAWGVRILASDFGLDPAVLICELEAIKPAESTIILLT